MVLYKISVSRSDGSFFGLVLFTEAAAGVAVFAQALLRRVNPRAADTAFRISILVRILLSVVGISLFLEGGERIVNPATNELVAPFFSPGLVTWTAFFTYEIGNGLLLLNEWMFSHLLEVEDTDARVDLGKVEAELEVLRVDLEATNKKLEAIGSDAETIRAELDLETNDVRAILAETLSVLGSLRSDNDKRRGFLEILQRAAKGKLKESEAIPGELEAIVVPLREAVRLREQLSRYAGRTINVGPNLQEFICISCGESSRKDRRKPPVCESCGADQNETRKAI